MKLKSGSDRSYPRLRRRRWWETAAEFSVPGTSPLVPAPPELYPQETAALDEEEPKRDD